MKVEIDLALRQAIPLIPILIGDTEMPKQAQLPSTISQLALRNALKLDWGPDFNSDMDHLIGYLDSIRITKSLGSRPVSDYRLIHDAAAAVLAFLKRECEVLDDTR